MMTKPQLLTSCGWEIFLTLVTWDEQHWQGGLFVLQGEGAGQCFYCHGEVVCSWLQELG